MRSPQSLPSPTSDPCQLLNCGPYAQCNNGQCQCLPEYKGVPPNCQPECTENDDCAYNMACIKQRCQDPCPGSCGLMANCLVRLHIPNCHCPDGFLGDPFRICYENKQSKHAIIYSICTVKRHMFALYDYMNKFKNYVCKSVRL